MIVLGKVTDPYGVRGWVNIRPYADDPATWAGMTEWWLAREDLDDWRAFRIEACRLHRDGLVCRLEGFTDRTGAESLKGLLVGAPREALPETQENEYYWADLIGLKVVNTANEVLGQVEGLIETGANTVLRVVSSAGEERLLPFVARIVLAVEKDKGCIRVDWGSDW